MGEASPLPPNNLASHPKRSTISLHHRQEHYMTETLLFEKQFNHILFADDARCKHQIGARLRAGFCSHKTLPKGYRVQQLKNLRRLLEENADRIKQALWHDLRKVCFLCNIMCAYILACSVIPCTCILRHTLA